MYYYDDTLEEMSEDHKSAILQKNKSPPDDGCINDNNKNFLKDFNNEKLYDSNVNFADKVNKPKNISTSNKKAPMRHTLEKLMEAISEV